MGYVCEASTRKLAPLGTDLAEYIEAFGLMDEMDLWTAAAMFAKALVAAGHAVALERAEEDDEIEENEDFGRVKATHAYTVTVDGCFATTIFAIVRVTFKRRGDEWKQSALAVDGRGVRSCWDRGSELVEAMGWTVELPDIKRPAGWATNR